MELIKNKIKIVKKNCTLIQWSKKLYFQKACYEITLNVKRRFYDDNSTRLFKYNNVEKPFFL
jgi:hypothetical protein